MSRLGDRRDLQLVLCVFFFPRIDMKKEGRKENGPSRIGSRMQS